MFSKLLQKNETELISKEYTLATPSTFNITVGSGSITIKSWSQNKVLIEATKYGSLSELQATSIYAKQTNNLFALETRSKESSAASVDYLLIVPENSSIRLKNNGSSTVKIKQVSGSLDIALNEGTIEIHDSTNTVVAKTNKGNIKVKQKKFTPTSSIFLETLKGNIALTLPRGTNATIQARTYNGSIETKQPITLSTRIMPLNATTWQQFRRDIEGKLGLGGAPITLETTNGTITLDE